MGDIKMLKLLDENNHPFCWKHDLKPMWIYSPQFYWKPDLELNWIEHWKLHWRLHFVIKKQIDIAKQALANLMQDEQIWVGSGHIKSFLTIQVPIKLAKKWPN